MTLDIPVMSERSLFEDPLSYLPCSPIRDYRKGQVIYDRDLTSSDLYVVIKGCVKVTRALGSAEIVMNLCQADDFFGESTFVQAPTGERAVAIQPTQIMSWPMEEIRELVLRNPALGIAFVQWMACRCFDLGERIATLSTDSTARRLGKALLQLAERLGESESPSKDARRLTPLSHKLLAQYIGTTREAVTHCMNQFRRDGLVSYTRRDLVIFCESLRQWLGIHDAATPPLCLPLSSQPDCPALSNGHSA